MDPHLLQVKRGLSACRKFPVAFWHHLLLYYYPYAKALQTSLFYRAINEPPGFVYHI